MRAVHACVQIFGNPAAAKLICSQHYVLYKDTGRKVSGAQGTHRASPRHSPPCLRSAGRAGQAPCLRGQAALPPPFWQSQSDAAQAMLSRCNKRMIKTYSVPKAIWTLNPEGESGPASLAASSCTMQADRGVLSSGEDFLRLLGHGVRAGQRRYYT